MGVRHRGAALYSPHISHIPLYLPTSPYISLYLALDDVDARAVAHELYLALDVLGRVGLQGQHLARGGAGEMQGDLGEVQGRCRGDAREMQGRRAWMFLS